MFEAATVLCVNKTARKLYFMKDGKVVDTVDVRTARKPYFTREGIFTVDRKEANSYSSLFHVYMPFSMYFSRGEAIHYSSDFAAVGYTPGGGSHGCVNVRDYNGIKQMFKNTPMGSHVVVYH